MTFTKIQNKIRKNKLSNHLCENLEIGDLNRLIHNELHIDEYKSKMGSDDDTCVLSFKVTGKDPASDLVNFFEKGYDWILDADVSAGEKEDGDYLVFIECQRDPNLPEKIMALISDLLNLTEQQMEDWRFRYYKSTDEYPLTIETLQSTIPLTVEEYRKKYENDQDHKDIDKLKSAAGINIDTKAPVNKHTDDLRVAAGIK